MTRYLPPSVHISPMPADFTWALLDDGKKVIKAEIELDSVKYEIGLRPKREYDEMRAAARDLIREVWQLKELHRIGRTDLLAYAAVGRHLRKPRFLPLKLD